jgi:hypothetical protein
MLVAMFASPIFTVARASPMVWMKPQVALRRCAHAEKVREKAMKAFGAKSTQRKRRKLKVAGGT